MQQATKEYVESRSIPVPEVGCWLWLQSVGSHGYGNAYVDRRVDVAHRVSFVAFFGPIPPGMLVQHSCDNHWCVAPHHLSLGTDATNAEDKQRKGRAARKLTAEVAVAIRESKTSLRKTASLFGVSEKLVLMIRQRKVWKHV